MFVKVWNIWSNRSPALYFDACLCRELTLEQFKDLLKEMAPKYQKDHKLANADAALDQMLNEIATKGPAMHGTTVSLTLVNQGRKCFI